MAVSSIQISLIPSKSDSPYLERKNCIVRKHRLVIELQKKRGFLLLACLQMRQYNGFPSPHIRCLGRVDCGCLIWHPVVRIPAVLAVAHHQLPMLPTVTGVFQPDGKLQIRIDCPATDIHLQNYTIQYLSF